MQTPLFINIITYHFNHSCITMTSRLGKTHPIGGPRGASVARWSPGPDFLRVDDQRGTISFWSALSELIAAGTWEMDVSIARYRIAFIWNIGQPKTYSSFSFFLFFSLCKEAEEDASSRSYFGTNDRNKHANWTRSQFTQLSFIKSADIKNGSLRRKYTYPRHFAYRVIFEFLPAWIFMRRITG